jgi:hypothetical protein
MKTQQNALIGNVATEFGINLNGSVDDNVPLIEDRLAGS